MSEAKRDGGRLRLPRKVREEEWKYVQSRRQAADVPDGNRPPVGLALSGGGIRSATFCLGILQKLAKKRLLKWVDYMCTVSGGGYIGSCLSSLTTVTETKDEHDRKLDRGDVQVSQCSPWHDESCFQKDAFRMEEPGAAPSEAERSPGEGFPLSREDQMHHLRTHGDFLITRSGLLKREMLRAIGALKDGILWMFALFFVGLLAVSGVLLVSGLFYGGSATWNPKGAPTYLLSTGAGWILGLVGVAVAIVSAVLSLRPRKPEQENPTGETLADSEERRFLVRFAIVLGSAAIVAPGVYLLAHGENVGFWGPTLIFAGALVGTFLCYPIWATYYWVRDHRSRITAMQGVCLLFVALGVVFVLLGTGVRAILEAQRAAETSDAADPRGSLGLFGALSLVVMRVLARYQAVDKKLGGWLGKLFKKWLPAVLMQLAVPLFLVLMIVVLAVWALDVGWWLTPLGLVLWVLLGYAVDFNRVSPHFFYRDRLVETYLQTERRVGSRLELVRDDSALRVHELHGPRSAAPYHLLLCALNLPGSRDLARRDRKSDHFVFARNYSGSNTTGYVETKACYEDMKLARVLTISGAAAASAMGAFTTGSRAIALTLFNIRLGAWVRHPDPDAAPRRGRWEVFHPPNPEKDPRKISRYRRKWSDGWTFWPRYLMREMTASATAGRPLVNLSDGGHTGDNVGLYALFQRRCEFIIACDGERDGDYSFGSLSTAIQQIYTDENVRVKIDLNRIRKFTDGQTAKKGRIVAESHVVVGKITYPVAPKDDHPRDRDEDESARYEARIGWLIYLKSCYTGKHDEPATVRSYAADHADFPHETTSDQFFDDAQFEAYRALGEYIADKAFQECPVPAPGTQEDFRAALRRWCARQHEGGAEAQAPDPAPDAASDEASRIRTVLDRLGNVRRAAAELGMSESKMRRLMKKHDIPPPSRRR